VAPDRIVLWGRSIGAAVAVDVAAGPAAGGPVAGVILESPFTSARDLLLGGGHRLFYGLSFFGTYRFDAAAKIGRITAPVLVVHGTADTIAPFALGERLHRLAPRPGGLVAIEGGDHNDLWAGHAAATWQGIRRFLDSLP
jgi:hypothetical protein